MSTRTRDDPIGQARRAHREVLLGALDGVEMNLDEQRLVEWPATWDDWTVPVTAMLIGAARGAGS
jgi:hypothetical protein